MVLFLFISEIERVSGEVEADSKKYKQLSNFDLICLLLHIQTHFFLVSFLEASHYIVAVSGILGDDIISRLAVFQS